MRRISLNSWGTTCFSDYGLEVWFMWLVIAGLLRVSWMHMREDRLYRTEVNVFILAHDISQ